MDKEFLRMQQLAGITNTNSNHDPICEIFVEYLTELHLLKNYYSKGILKENISVNEINLLESTFREKIKTWFKKNAIKPTEAYILTLINKFEKSAKKLGIVNWKDSLFKFSTKQTDYTEENSDEFFPDIEDSSPVSKSDKVNKTALAFLGIFITKLVIATSLSLSTLIPQAKEVPPSFTDTATKTIVSDENQDKLENIENSIKSDFSQDDPLKTPIITSDSLDVVDVEFPTGEFELDADLEKELVNKLVDNVKKTISSNKNIDSLTIEYGGSIDDIGSDTGNENNPDGPDKDGLKDLRTGVGKNIADKAIKILKSSFKNVKFNAVKFDNKDNKAGIGFDLNEKTKKDPTPKPQSFIPLDARKEKPQPLPKPPPPITDKPLDKTSETTPPKTPPISTDLERDITNIANLNRNNQIAFVLAKTNNKLNLYRQLGIKNIIDIPDGEFNNIATKGEYNGKPVTPQAQLLAQNVIRSRKNPNAFINAYAKITGTNRGGNRRKASITTGAKGKSSSAPIKENEISSIDLLEASIDKILADNPLPTTFKQKAFLAKLINVIYYGEEGKDVLDIESSTDDRFKKEYKEIPSPLGSQEKGERYVYLDKLQTPDKYDITVIKNLFSKIPQLSILLKKINTKAELADFILALFLHTNEQGEKLFSDRAPFTTGSGKVRSALFGLNNRIPNTLQEILFGEAEETPETPDKNLFDVEKFYKILDSKPTILARLKTINTIEEFYQFCLEIIFPSLNDTFKTKSGVSQIKQAIALAANSSTKYKSILDAKPKPVNEEFYRMQQLAGLIKENTASDIDAFFDKDLWSGAAKQGVILKLIQYLIQEREREALNFSGNNTKLVDELKKYLAQIPKDKIETLKVKNGEEIQNIFKKSIEPLINYLGKSGALN